MSFFSSFKELVSDAGVSISASAKKLVSTGEGNGSNDEGSGVGISLFGGSGSTEQQEQTLPTSRLHLPIAPKSSSGKSPGPSRRNSYCRFPPADMAQIQALAAASASGLTVPQGGPCSSAQTSPITSPSRTSMARTPSPTNRGFCGGSDSSPHLLSAGGNSAQRRCSSVKERGGHKRMTKDARGNTVPENIFGVGKKDGQVISEFVRKRSVKTMLEKQKPKLQPKHHPKYDDLPDKWEETVVKEST